MKINDKKITSNYNYKFYQDKLDSLLKNTSGTRNKTIASALFLATTFPHLPYFWGGGHDYIYNGIDPSWGTSKTVTATGHETTGTKQQYSLDCSGYVSWALKNGGYDIDKPKVTKELEQMGKVTNLKGIEPTTIQNGDLAYMDGHVGMIINIENNNITIAHCSGSGNGMNITTIDTKTGKVVADETNKERIGNVYFDRIISLVYKD